MNGEWLSSSKFFKVRLDTSNICFELGMRQFCLIPVCFEVQRKLLQRVTQQYFLGHANQCCAWLSIFPRCHDIFRRVGKFLPGQNTFYCINNFFFNVSTRDVKTQSFTAIRFFNYFIFSLKPCKSEVAKLLCPLVIIFRRITAFKLVKKSKVGARGFIHYDQMVWFYLGKIEANRLFRLIKSSSFGIFYSYNHRIIDDRIEKSIKGRRIRYNLHKRIFSGCCTGQAAPTDNPAFVSISRLLRHSSLRRGNPTLRKWRHRHHTFLFYHL